MTTGSREMNCILNEYLKKKEIQVEQTVEFLILD